jgi:hypothetical protein
MFLLYSHKNNENINKITLYKLIIFIMDLIVGIKLKSD